MEKIKSITRGQAILFGFILVCFIGVFIGLKIANNNRIKSYIKFQKELVDVAKNYRDINNIDLDFDEEYRVELSALKKQNLVTNSLKNKCDGYVIIANEEIYPDKYKLVYRAYIKCGKYKTDSYVEY